ncbi:MAG: peptidylprolyl isomerase [Verrucomicrobia bacterium]|nr:peptidylprolyl isomerase [Verrucomicrobiota bacterium]
MKKIVPLLAFAALGALASPAQADEVAVLQFKTGAQVQRVVLEFYEDSAPNTVANFKKLAASGFYNGTAIHRVFAHLMVQAGDPLSKKKGTGAIGTGGPGYTLSPEIRRKQAAGAVAAARLPDKINPARRSNGSQFFVSLQPMPNLDGQYTVFAHVAEGLDVLDKISQTSADTNDSPVQQVVLTSVRIVEREQAQTSDASGKNWLQRNFERLF